MDNNSIFLTQKKFDEVWGRVTGTKPSDADTLKTLMGYEYADWNIYRMLAQKYTGEARTRFTEMANDELRHFRTLHARYYILTGQRFTPEKAQNISVSPINSVLRDRYGIESEAAAGYFKAAEETQMQDMAEMYQRNALDEQKHMRIVMELLGKMLR